MEITIEVQDEELKAENAALRRNIADMKVRLEVAIDALSKISVGQGKLPLNKVFLHFSGPVDIEKIKKLLETHYRTTNWKEYMKEGARQALAQIAKMPLREGP